MVLTVLCGLCWMYACAVQAQLADREVQLAEAQKAATTAHAEAQAARAALAAAQQEQRGDAAALRQQLEAELEKVRWPLIGLLAAY